MLLGNMGKPGGGVNALRGIGNVQGSTDMGLLFGNTIGYNYKQPTGPSGTQTMEQAFDAYFDGLFGDPFPEKAPSGVPRRFQQRGFHNLQHAWFSDGSETATRKAHDLYAFYPKGNGLNHRQFFQQTAPDMPGYNPALPDVKAMVVWGMNPGNVEANQPLVRKGLKNLDTLVVTEIFLTETAEAERKADGVTYFLPAACFAETTGTIINSGRWIQRRWAARDARGNTKADYEILLRLIKALHDNGAIAPGVAGSDAWPVANYDGSMAGTDNGFTALWGRYFLGSHWNGTGNVALPAGTFSKELVTELADNIYREFGAPLHGVADPRPGVSKTWYGTMWIYSNIGGGARTDGPVLKSQVVCAYEPLITPANYPIGTVADGSLEGFISTDDEGKVAEFDGLLCKSYNPWDSSVTFRGTPNAGLSIHPYWAVAWLFNRRVMYNMGTTTSAGDTADLFVAPDQVSRFFVHHTSDPIGATGQGRTGGITNYTWFYRAYSRFGDADFHTPRHVEPWESPVTSAERAAFESGLGKSVAPVGIGPPEAYASTDALRQQYPLVFTTFRYVMHYQGGSMTRNLGYINAVRPRPYIELHPEDAAARGITNGDDVSVQTMRGKNVGPFVALVDDTIKKGVTGVPWHWGDRGLNTGPSANYACIDALDASTTMPETKACLCNVTKATV
jgi:anaerobic selenocysteine-containing dehydrogenase